MSKWKLWVAFTLTLLLGVGIGAQGAETVEVEREVEVVREVEVEVVREVEVPVEVEVIKEIEVEVDSGRLNECYAYIAFLFDGMDQLNEITQGGLREMAEILDRDGFMVTFEYVDILDRMTEQTIEATAGWGEQGRFDC